MLIHIVKTGETVDKIVDSYRVLKSDLISNNQHITDFSHLKSGMKLKIPLLSKDTIEVLEETEAFIDDYYPSFEKFLNNNETTQEEVKEDVINEAAIVECSEVITDDNVSKCDVAKEVKVEYQEEVKETIRNDKPHNNNVYQQNQNYYRGNVIPSYNQKFIKKI